MDHSIFDKRKYPVVDVRDGYAEWAGTYDRTVQDEMDLRLLERLGSVDWSAPKVVLDLACGTGRIGVWLSGHCSAAIDGVDITPEMLAAAEGRGIYRKLICRNAASTTLSAKTYDLCIQSLADEHLPDLAPLYQEVARVSTTRGKFVLVGYHPQFLMAGIPTHFERASGDPVTIRSYVHLLSDHVKAAHAQGWALLELDEGVIDDAWLQKKPQWKPYFGMPVSFAMVWQRRETNAA